MSVSRALGGERLPGGSGAHKKMHLIEFSVEKKENPRTLKSCDCFLRPNPYQDIEWTDVAMSCAPIPRPPSPCNDKPLARFLSIPDRAPQSLIGWCGVHKQSAKQSAGASRRQRRGVDQKGAAARRVACAQADVPRLHQTLFYGPVGQAGWQVGRWLVSSRDLGWLIQDRDCPPGPEPAPCHS